MKGRELTPFGAEVKKALVDKRMLIDPTKIKSLADLERLMQWIIDYIKSHGGTPTPSEG